MATSWHLTSLAVLGGPLHGKKLEIEDVVVEVLIGSDPDCHLHLDLPSVSPIHARLWIEPDDVTVYGTRSGPGVFVNFGRVEGDGKLRPGDMLWLGPPQAAGSVMLQAAFEERDSLPPILVNPLSEEEVPPEAAAKPAPGAPVDETLGVLPEGAPTPLQLAISREEAVVPSAEPARTPEAEPVVVAQLPSPEPPPIVAPPPAVAPAEGSDDFLIMDQTRDQAPREASPPAAEEFVISGFEASWPESAPPSPAPPASTPPVSDAFFVETGPGPGPVFAPPTADEAFFIDDGSLPTAPAPPASVSTAAPEAEDFFFEEPAPKAAPPPVRPPPTPAPTPRPEPPAVLEGFSFADEAPPSLVAPPAPTKAVAPTISPSAKPPAPTSPAPTSPPAAPTAPPAAKARVPPATPATAPTPPKTAAAPPAPSAVPPATPSTTGAVRPVRRPDTSQAVPRGDRPPVPRPDRTQPVRPTRRSAPPVGRYVAIGAAAVAVAAVIGFAAMSMKGAVRLATVEPSRARVGDTVVLTGQGFATTPAGNVVLIADKEANVATATDTRLEVMVPDVAAGVGHEERTSVRVRVGRAESQPIEITVYAGPTVHGISPDVAMPGDEVVLAGSDWGLGPTVRFGGRPADVLEARETSIRVRVPAIDGGPGTSAPVVVTAGSLESNPAPFYVGRIPLVTKVEPTTVAAGDVITINGRGFRRERTQNTVQIGGVRALVVSAFDSEIKVVVPRQAAAGSGMLELRVPSAAAPAVVAIVVTASGPTVEFRFVAEPFDAVPGRDHAVLATGLGPSFVLASSGGRSAAERAVEAARRLNEAAGPLKASRDLSFELRQSDPNPVLALSGRPEVLLDVTEEDAVAYGEDWTGLRGRGGPVTQGRLARWWEAMAKDLVLLLVRGERPRFAAELAPEGRAFLDLFQAAERAGGLGISAQVVAQARPPLRDALRLVAFRVPPAVSGPATAVPVLAIPTPPPTPAGPAAPMPRLDGIWVGSETEDGRQRDLSVSFRGSTGTIAYEGTVTVSVPLIRVEQSRGNVRFTVEVRGGLRYYAGRWDGQALSGKISPDPVGTQTVATFELRPR